MENDILKMEPAEKSHSAIIKLPASLAEKLNDYAAAMDISLSKIIQASLEKDAALQQKLKLPEGYSTPKHKRKAVA